MAETPDPNQLWKDLLSGDPEKIRAAWSTLTPDERESIRGHLERMARGSDWQPVQRKAAETALTHLTGQKGG